MKKRFILTPDEALDMAKAMFESKFGGHHQPVEDKVVKPMPVLLPKPIRVVPTPKGEGATVQQLRKAQIKERKRSRFNRAVRQNVVRKSKALTAEMRAQIRAVKAAYRAAKRQQRAQVQAAIKRAEEAKKAAENLRKQVQAAREWLRLEKARKRELDCAVKARIREAKAQGFWVLPEYHSQEWEWGASCPLHGYIRGLATAAAVIWAAENK